MFCGGTAHALSQESTQLSSQFLCQSEPGCVAGQRVLLCILSPAPLTLAAAVALEAPPVLGLTDSYLQAKLAWTVSS
jgi:hypothetical protein